jgi:hypothetical protein
MLDKRLKKAASQSEIANLVCDEIEDALAPLIEDAKEELSEQKFLSVDMEDICSFFNSIQLSNGHLVTIYIVFDGKPCPINVIDQYDTAESFALELRSNIEQLIN